MSNQNQLVINYDDINLLVQGSKAVTLNPHGEEVLIKLLELKDKVEMAIDQCKSIVGVAMADIDPDLSSVSSDNLKVMNRVYGSKYYLDENLIEFLDPKFYTEKKSYSLNTSEVDKEIKENGNLPNGISLINRQKTVSITLKNKPEKGELLWFLE